MIDQKTERNQATPRRVGYVVSQYPAYSHAFIANEIEGLAGLGWDVHTFSIRKPNLADPASRRKTYVLQTRPIAKLLPTIAWSLIRPIRISRGFRAVGEIYRDRESRGRSAWLRQVAYLLEALILSAEVDRRQIRHLHVHFANNAADIVRLASEILGRDGIYPRLSWSLTIHGPADFERGTENDLRGKAKAADLLFCISEYARKEMLKFVSENDASRARICRMGVSDETLKVLRDVRGRPVSGSALNILFVGRLVGKKDPHGLMLAVARFAQMPLVRDQQIRLTIVGEGPERSRLESTRAELPDNVSLILTGAERHERVLQHLAQADIFCLPSFSEGLPVVIMEALAARIAVIATPVAAVPELVVNGRTGVLVSPGHTGELVEALAKLARSSSLRERLGSEGRVAVEAEFVSSQSARGLGLLFSKILSPK